MVVKAAWAAMAVGESRVICTDLACVGAGFNEKIQLMIFQLAHFSVAAFIALGLAAPLHAQESNVLGLPAIPQPKPGSTSPAGAASGASAAKGTAVSAVASRDAISGELGLQHSAREGVGRLIVTTRTIFATAGARSSALDTAKLVQKELTLACGKQCKPIAMTAPKVLSSGQLEFELAFAPLHQHLSQAQFLAALQGKPLNLLPAQLQAPGAAPAAVSVQSVTATSNAPASSSPTK